MLFKLLGNVREVNPVQLEKAYRIQEGAARRANAETATEDCRNATRLLNRELIMKD